MMFARHDIAKLVGTGIAVAALSLTTPGSAAADATDDAFLHKLFDDAVNFSGAENDYPEGPDGLRGICLRHVASERSRETLNHSAFSPRQAAIFMADAVQAYCPRYAAQFIS